jgi:hypothetical protein
MTGEIRSPYQRVTECLTRNNLTGWDSRITLDLYRKRPGEYGSGMMSISGPGRFR